MKQEHEKEQMMNHEHVHHHENERDQRMMHDHSNSMEHHEHHDHGEKMGHTDHHDHHKMMVADFRGRFFISLILSIPVLALSPMIQQFFRFTFVFPGSLYLLGGLATFVFFYGGWPFLKGLFTELKQKNPGMMTLIAVAISVAYFYSMAVILGLKGKMFFWELVTLIDIMLLGHWIEMKSVMGASRALELLVQMLPSEAHLLRKGQLLDVSVKELKRGDTIVVKPGEKVPADGMIIEGESYLNESMLTGESRPVHKIVDQQVIGGSINGNGVIHVKIKGTGEDSYLNKVINLVREAQQSKSKTQHLADRAAKWLTFIALTIGLGTLIVWLSLGKDFVFALERMVTVMVIACPHALGLAIPLVVGHSTAISAQKGLLIRNRTAFENSRKINTIVFDKTGTLTKGNFAVSRVESTDSDFDNTRLLQWAAALEQTSEHPIATGIVNKAKEQRLELPNVSEVKAIIGKGLVGNIDNRKVKVVSPGYLKELNIGFKDNASNNNDIETVVYVMVDNKVRGLIALSDEIRPESLQAVRQLQSIGIRVLMATGDNEKTAHAVSKYLGLNGSFAEVLPHQKLEIVKKLQGEGRFVAMTGDGVNDAPALAQADVGIAVGSGTDVAAETADIILVNSNPRDILNLVLFGKATYRKMIQNLVWATGYNAFAIPLAAGVLYSVGFVLGPAIGAVFMSLSTVIVALNAQLLKRQMKKLTA